MALTMYFTRTPRYEGIGIKDIKLIESYLNWQHEIEVGGKYASESFEKWCGHSETELPEKNVIEYFKTFYSKKEIYIEGIGRGKRFGICEQMTRLVKTNQIFRWFIVNLMDGNASNEYYEVTKEQLNALYKICSDVKDSFTFLGKNKHTNECEYLVDKAIASKLLPLMEEVGYFFGPVEYNILYSEQIIKAMDAIKNIISTTDFDNQTIYFNASW